MTSSNKDCAAFDELVPLYVKGLLTDEKRREFEKSIAECPHLKETIEEWKFIQDAYKEVECTLPQLSKNAFPIIMEKVREAKKQNWFEGLMPSPSLSFAIMAVQLIIIITLGFYLLQAKHEYKTLSSPSVVASEPVKINIVFREKTTENEVRKLLLKIDGKIIDGPYSSGLYIVGIKSGADPEQTLKVLRENKIVAIAEKAY